MHAHCDRCVSRACIWEKTHPASALNSCLLSGQTASTPHCSSPPPPSKCTKQRCFCLQAPLTVPAARSLAALPLMLQTLQHTYSRMPLPPPSLQHLSNQQRCVQATLGVCVVPPAFRPVASPLMQYSIQFPLPLPRFQHQLNLPVPSKHVLTHPPVDFAPILQRLQRAFQLHPVLLQKNTPACNPQSQHPRCLLTSTSCPHTVSTPHSPFPTINIHHFLAALAISAVALALILPRLCHPLPSDCPPSLTDTCSLCMSSTHNTTSPLTSSSCPHAPEAAVSTPRSPPLPDCVPSVADQWIVTSVTCPAEGVASCLPAVASCCFHWEEGCCS